MSEPKRGKSKWGTTVRKEINPEEIIFNHAPLPEICTNPNLEGTPIQEFYSGAHVFITGNNNNKGYLLF